jgi:hypothetical protein
MSEIPKGQLLDLPESFTGSPSGDAAHVSTSHMAAVRSQVIGISGNLDEESAP